MAHEVVASWAKATRKEGCALVALGTMLLRKVALHAPLTFVALLGATTLLAVTIAPAGARSNVPAHYRYAGVVENGRGIPAHYIATGDGFRFYFFDSLSQGRRSEAYGLCIGRPRKAPIRCWNRTANYGVGKLTFSFVLPRNVPLGALTARWLRAGRAVATWPFLYVRGR